MRLYFLLFLSCFCLTQSFAQFDRGNNPVNIPPARLPNLPTPKAIPEKKPSIFDVKPKEEKVPNPWDNPKDRKAFGEQNDFMDPNERFTKKLNNSLKGEGNGDYKIFRRNQYFGDFKTTSESIKIAVRDPQAIDGDYVKITRDGIVIYASIFLDSNFKTLEIPLNVGFNKIEFIALNEGSSFPNTGAFLVTDQGKKIYQEEWNLATGFNASFLIIRE